MREQYWLLVKKLANNPISWIVLFFVIRLVGITNPPLEVAHSWRQVTVNMVARNFLESGPNLLYPKVDMAGDLSGITGMEFPFLNYLIYLVSLVFGYAHWYGKLINLVVSSLGIYCFFRLTLQYFERKTVLFATLILLSSMWFSYARNIMPDTFSTSLVIIGLYFAFSFFKEGKSYQFVVFFLCFALGVLSKVPALYLGGVLIFPLFNKKISISRKLLVFLGGLITFGLTMWWYLFWVPQLVKEYGFWHYYMGVSVLQGLKELFRNFAEVAAAFYAFGLGYIGGALFLIGIIQGIRKRRKDFLWLLLVTFLSFFAFMIKAGFYFALHGYYVIPFVPVMAIISAYAITNVPNVIVQRIIVFLIVVEGIANQQHDFFIKSERRQLLQLEGLANEIVPKNALIGITGEDDPTEIYFTNRKGWVLKKEQLESEAFLLSIKEKGCEFIIVSKNKNILLSTPLVYKGKNYLVYRL